MTSFKHSAFLAWCLAAGAALAQFDPLKDFCRRWGHQSAIVDRKLYIDGGLVNYKPFTAESQNMSNTFLAYNDLNSVSSGGMPQLYANLAKNATVPNVNGGILWEDSVNKRLYLYGGEVVGTRPSAFVLYSYDILYNQWVSFGAPGGAQTINAVSYGAGVSVPARGEAYYYGGWQSNASVPGWSGPPVATNRMIKYVMDTNSWSNVTGPDDVRRAEGVMVFLPIGDAGMLVYFGGTQDLYGDGSLTPQPLDKIFLYDVANTKWYTQRTTGRTPENRRRFCAGATWAPDQSSYNIYIYGGGGFPPSAGYDDIYILSLPSFQWIRGPYPAGSNVTGAYPKSMMTCNVVDNAQMLVIGGTYSNDTTYMCDADTIWGEHNMNLGEQNENKAIWGSYQPSLTTYVVPTDILTAVGGNPTGGATVTRPTGGFDFPDLSVQMTRRAAITARSPTRDVNVGGAAPPLSTGAIAGIAVGGGVVLIAAVVGCCIFFRRRRKAGLLQKEQQRHQQQYGQSQTHSHYSGSPSQGHARMHSQHTFPAISHVSSPTLTSTTAQQHRPPPVELASGVENLHPGYPLLSPSPGAKYNDAHVYQQPMSELPTTRYTPAPTAESVYPSPTPTRASHGGYPQTPPGPQPPQQQGHQGYGQAQTYPPPQGHGGGGYGQGQEEYQHPSSNFGSPRQEDGGWDNGGDWGGGGHQQQSHEQQQQQYRRYGNR